MIVKTDHLGIPIFTDNNLIELIYSGKLDQCHTVLCETSNDVNQFNVTMEEQNLPSLQTYSTINIDRTMFDSLCQSEWFMPEQYKNISDAALQQTLIERCKTTEQTDRVIEEFNVYQQRDMTDLLKFIMYLVDYMREHNIVWGVGRGSSVSSYILYLIGIHKVDSIKYKLDWKEFLK